jgi:hypothetical protein
VTAPLAAIEWGKLGEVVWVSLVMGVGVVALFAVVVYGGSKVTECRRTGRGIAGYAGLAAVCMLGFIGVVVFAVAEILNKS